VEEKDANIEQQKIQWVNAGTYCIHPSCINHELFCIDSNNTQREYYLTDIFAHIKKNKKTILLCELPVEKNMEVFGVNTVKELEELQNYLLNSKANDKPSISLRLSMPVSVTSISLMPSKGLIEELERKKELKMKHENEEK
jgi:bifunctional UDP-N-acetylglucosamine pyrophosphorylase/glucosamine-1-phosphate N-acetyltransferase